MTVGFPTWSKYCKASSTFNSRTGLAATGEGAGAGTGALRSIDMSGMSTRKQSIKMKCKDIPGEIGIWFSNSSRRKCIDWLIFHNN